MREKGREGYQVRRYRLIAWYRPSNSGRMGCFALIGDEQEPDDDDDDDGQLSNQ